MAIPDAALRLRPGRPSDAVLLARVQSRAAVVAYAHIFPPEAPKPTPEALTPSWTDVLIDQLATVIVAEDAVTADGGGADGRAHGVVGGVVGGVVVRADTTAPSGFLLERLYVDPARWSAGVGGLLHDEAVRAARERGAWRMNLWVLRHNHRAREMYERRGWRLVAGEQLAHTSPPITEVRYELELPGNTELPADTERRRNVGLPDNEEGPAGGSRSFVSRETMLGGTCSTSTTRSVGECALFDHPAIRPIEQRAAARQPAQQAG